MTKEELYATLGPPILGLLATVATLVMAYVTRLINAQVTNVNFRTASLKLADIVTTGVKAAEQTTVQQLKDPNMPGVWTPEGGAHLKAVLTAQIMASFSDVKKVARDLGLATVEELKAYIEKQIEASVLDLRRAPTADAFLIEPGAIVAPMTEEPTR